MNEALFALVSLLPLPAWTSMVLFPSSRFTLRLITSPWPLVVLGAAYALLLLAALLTSAPADLALSAAALRAGLSSDFGFLAAWTHLLALDLFAGIWILRDSRYFGIEARGYLLLVLFLGPAGLAAYLLRRRGGERRQRARTLN